MRRREFIAGLGSAAAWPVVARAQQTRRVRRVGVLLNLADDDPATLTRVTAFVQALQALGWIDGRNVRIDYRWSAGEPERIRGSVVEMVALAPDVILASGSPIVRALQEASRGIPIVFVGVTDAVGGGLVESLARPGGYATGFYGRVRAYRPSGGASTVHARPRDLEDAGPNRTQQRLPLWQQQRPLPPL